MKLSDGAYPVVKWTVELWLALYATEALLVVLRWTQYKAYLP